MLWYEIVGLINLFFLYVIILYLDQYCVKSYCILNKSVSILPKSFSHLVAHSFADRGNGRVARVIWSRSFLSTDISNPKCAARFFRRVNKQPSVTDRFFLSLKYAIDFFTTTALKARCLSCAPSSVRDCLCDSVLQHSMAALQRPLIKNKF